MRIGVPAEIKNHEYRVGMVPAVVREMVGRGHEVLVQQGAGLGIGVSDEDYRLVGAKLVKSPQEIFSLAQMIVKVKEPQPNECRMLRDDHILFTYLHLAPDPEQAQLLKASGCAAIAYETVTDHLGGLPLLKPMSEVAGRMSIQVGAHWLEKAQGGRGVLLGGVPGVPAADVLIIGGGVVGTNALRMAVGMEANVTIVDRCLDRLRYLNDLYSGSIQTLYSTAETIEKCALKADLVIGAVLIPGAAAPKLIHKAWLKHMKPGSVLVDVAIDQGGCFETSHPTTFSDPTFVVDRVIHYCVANMPGGAARTSAFALNNATSRFIVALADQGVQKACLADIHLRSGLNVYQGRITHEAVAEALGEEYLPAHVALT